MMVGVDQDSLSTVFLLQSYKEVQLAISSSYLQGSMHINGNSYFSLFLHHHVLGWPPKIQLSAPSLHPLSSFSFQKAAQKEPGVGGVHSEPSVTGSCD